MLPRMEGRGWEGVTSAVTPSCCLSRSKCQFHKSITFTGDVERETDFLFLFACPPVLCSMTVWIQMWNLPPDWEQSPYKAVSKSVPMNVISTPPHTWLIVFFFSDAFRYIDEKEEWDEAARTRNVGTVNGLQDRKWFAAFFFFFRRKSQ